MATYTAGRKRLLDVSLRWNFGSGFPFTQVSGFYEKLPYNNISFDPYTESGYLGLLYGDINTGQLPSYHRLDFNVKRKFNITENIKLEADFSITNVYNQRNIFYIDVVSTESIYQLPFMPSLGLTLSF